MYLNLTNLIQHGSGRPEFISRNRLQKDPLLLLATLLELELTGTVENIGWQIYLLTIELELPLN